MQSSGYRRGTYPIRRVNPRSRIQRPWLHAIPVFIAVFVTVILFHLSTGLAAPTRSAVFSGVTGYCLDDLHDKPTSGNPVIAWECNHSAAQDWSIELTSVRHPGDECLSVMNDATTADSPVIITSCNQSPGQVWLRDQDGLINPNSGLCLSLPNGAVGKRLVIASCDKLASPSETWHQNSLTNAKNTSCTGTEGDKVACAAIQEWIRWQSGQPNHEDLLSQYTNGAPYESWCADFVSYVYRAAGYPFTGGESDKWDENNANNIQNMGFVRHDADTYIPRPGDVAYFTYDGGHVEIVVSGGKTPTFIYGNSGTIDPTTGNGQMKANTITSDGDVGKLLYYLSPR